MSLRIQPLVSTAILLFGQVFTSAAAATAASAASAGAPPRIAERALAIPMGTAGRDALLVRNEDGSGFALFAPLQSGGFELRIYAGEGPNVAQVVLADANGDGVSDLIAVRSDGSTSKWYANGEGDFAPEEVAAAPGHGGHGVHAAAAVDPVHAAHLAEQAGRDLRGAFDTGVSTLGADPAAAVEAGARTLHLRGADGTITALPSQLLPEGFHARALAVGRFGDRGETRVAIAGGGERPRVVLVDPAPARNDGATSAAASYGVRDASVAFTTFMVTVGSGGFTFAPDAVNIQPGDTVQWNWAGIGHTVTSGSPCVVDNQFCSPNNASCATAAASSTGATYSHTFPAAGTFNYFCRPHCSFGMTGRVVVAAPAAAGTVPDGDTVAGVPLKLGKGAAGTIDATWAASCSAGATNYALYEGALPVLGAYTHASLNCSLGNTTSANFAPGAGDAYYLVVPQTASSEGSYGSDRIGGVAHAIPAAAAPCRAQTVAPCP